MRGLDTRLNRLEQKFLTKKHPRMYVYFADEGEPIPDDLFDPETGRRPCDTVIRFDREDEGL